MSQRVAEMKQILLARSASQLKSTVTLANMSYFSNYNVCLIYPLSHGCVLMQSVFFCLFSCMPAATLLT